jgi:HTH-type transcriptional regulator, sugar sensing transcriptional regulator
MDIQKALMEFGLNEKEAKVYLFLLERGQNKAQDISKQTGIIRQTVYELLNKLEHLGLVSEITQNKKNSFEASKPDKLLSLLDEKKKILESVMPSLNELENKITSRSNARLYRGIKGIKAINEEVLKSKEIKTILPKFGEELMKDFYVGNFSVKRIKRKTPLKILRGEIKNEFQKSILTDKKALREVRFLEELNEIETQWILYNDSIAIISFHKDPFGVIIEDKLICATFNLLYEILWKIAKS